MNNLGKDIAKQDLKLIPKSEHPLEKQERTKLQLCNIQPLN